MCPQSCAKGAPQNKGALGCLAVVEAVAARGALDQELGRREALPVFVRVAAHPAEQLGRPERVRVPERASTEGRKAEPKDRADVAIARVSENAFGQTSDRFGHHLDREP